MKRLIHSLFALLLCAACAAPSAHGPFRQADYTPAYAAGFRIDSAAGRTSRLLRTLDPWQGAEGTSTELLLLRADEPVPEGFEGQVLPGEAHRIVCLSSTHVAMFHELGCADRIVGASGVRNLSTPGVAERLGTAGEIGYEGAVDWERLVALEPDLVTLFGVSGASPLEPKLRELGIPFVYLGEYLEQSPLGKAEWLVAAAELVGRRAEGETLFSAIPPRYEALKNLASQAEIRPRVMLNTPYGEHWFMASTTSYLARLIADAGGDYIYNENHTNRSLPIDTERAYLLLCEADYWLHLDPIASIDELQARHPRLGDVPCVQSGQLYNCDRRRTPAGGNDYWESGAVRPDRVLADLVAILHPALAADTTLYYYRKLR